MAPLACTAGPGGSVVASDLHASRAGLVRRNAERLGLTVLVLAQDAIRPAIRGPFDRVLVDAPCSGLGSARRRPELLWRPRREDLSALARQQVAIVSSAADLLRPGGRLVANAVTLETEAVLLARHAAQGGELVRIAVSRADSIGEKTGWRPAMPVTQWVWTKP